MAAHFSRSIKNLQGSVQCCFTSTETIRAFRDGEPRTATSTFTQLLSSDLQGQYEPCTNSEWDFCLWFVFVSEEADSKNESFSLTEQWRARVCQWRRFVDASLFGVKIILDLITSHNYATVTPPNTSSMTVRICSSWNTEKQTIPILFLHFSR